MNARIVVAGAGLAGHEFVRRMLASPGFEGTVTWHTAEPGRPYNRVLLTDLLAGRHTPEAISLPALADPRLTYRRTPLGSIATAAFDFLVLATGADPVIPPVRGNAVPLRTLNDARTILRALADGARRVAVVGGGPLGVETACALARRGVRVDLVHRGPHLLSRWLDAESAALLTDSLSTAGITVRCGTEVSAATGTWPTADLVVLACGTRPRVSLARAAGLPFERGILVDADGRSPGDPRVFAIGDCAENGAVGAFAALDDARRAAVKVSELAQYSHPSPTGGHTTLGNIVPVCQPPKEVPTGSFTRSALRLRTYDVPGADVAVLGRPLADPTIQLTDQRRRTRKALTLEGDAPIAAALVGDVRAAPALARAIADPATPPPSVPLALLTSPSLRDAAGFDRV
ncbi:NAD(P)/FAD-dependent oxidoreductase [Catenulispora subtropica]|uniref:FAD-dependent oxidoreductase n=1 Tax=Catenulispora subtropica TaxID=450798 RepID=A0ABP5ENN4_9ACTN